VKVLGFIPARGGSKGIPKKNLYPLAGKPLLQYTVEAAKQSQLSDVFVSTDDLEIQNLALQLGAQCDSLRPAQLAGDTSVIEDAIGDYLQKSSEKFDAVMLLQPTSPLRNHQHIDESLKLFLNSDADSLVSVSEPLEHPADMVYWKDEKMHFLFEDKIKPGYTQRQQFEHLWFTNGAIYLFKTESFLKTKSRFGSKTIPYEMPADCSIDVDSLSHMKIAEALLSLELESKKI